MPNPKKKWIPKNQQGGKIRDLRDLYRFLDQPKETRTYNYVEPREVQDNRYRTTELNAAYQNVPESVRMRAQEVYNNLVSESNRKRDSIRGKIWEPFQAEQEALYLKHKPELDSGNTEPYYVREGWLIKDYIDRTKPFEIQAEQRNKQYFNDYMNTLRKANPTLDSLLNIPVNQDLLKQLIK